MAATLHYLCLSPPSSLANLPAIAAASTTKLSSSAAVGFTGTHPSPPDLQISLPADLPSELKEKILSLEIMGVDSGRALSLNPDLADAPPGSVHSVIAYLCSKGIRHDDLPRIFGVCPKLLTSSVPADLAPVFHFLARELRVPRSRLRHVIIKCPRLLACSVPNQLRPALAYLRSLGFEDTEALALHDPVLLASSVERTLVPKLEFLVGVGFGREEAVGMVRRCPGLFTFSVENNFRPKLEYLVGEMGGTLEELKEFPQYFAFSLEKRIKPRHREMCATGVKLPLAAMLKSTDDEFKELIKNGSR